MSLIVLIADDDQDDDESIVKRPHTRQVTTWQGINRLKIFSLPFSIAGAQKSRQIPRGNRDAHAKGNNNSRFVHAGAKSLNSRSVRLLIRSRLIRPLAGWLW